jgi:uncharacterized protein
MTDPGPGGGLLLRLLPGRLAVCRLDAGQPVPAWALSSAFVSVTRTETELSIVCAEAEVPDETRAERGFRAFQVAGPLEFSLTGLLESLLEPLARASIPVFVLSTHDTDYLLVREADRRHSVVALRRAGHRIPATAAG